MKSVGVRFFRPGVAKRRSEGPNPSDVWPMEVYGPPENLYRETFPLLDMEVQVIVATLDFPLRTASFRAVKEALAEFREVDRIAGGKVGFVCVSRRTWRCLAYTGALLRSA